MADFKGVIDLCAESSDDEEQAAALTARLDAEEASLALARQLQAEENARGPAPAEAPEEPEALAEAPPEASEPAAEDAAPPAKRQKTSPAAEPSEAATSAAAEQLEAAVSSQPPATAATGRVVRIATWNAQSVNPDTENWDNLRTTLELLGQPDLLAVQETLHVKKFEKEKKSKEMFIHEANTAECTAKIVAKAAELGYDALLASPDPTQYKGNDNHCKGTALFVKRDGL